MSQHGTVIFRRGNSVSSESGENSADDMWDDKILINVYDKALNVAREEVAKRLAMNTNSKGTNQKSQKKNANVESKKNDNSQNNKKKLNWRVGSECRAVYSGDGLEYEANIIFIDGDRCIISYVGYNNEEEIALKDLKPSLGKHHKTKQLLEANDLIPSNDGEELGNSAFSEYDQSDTALSTMQKGKKKHYKDRKKAIKQDKNGINEYNGFPLPPLSSFMPPSFSPSMSIDGNMPLPPPPFLPQLNTGNTPHEDQALSTMLISWYMSGYYTGLYQGQQMSKRS